MAQKACTKSLCKGLAMLHYSSIKHHLASYNWQIDATPPKIKPVDIDWLK
jgi:hypothetical protein